MLPCLTFFNETYEIYDKFSHLRILFVVVEGMVLQSEGEEVEVFLGKMLVK